MIKFRRLYLLVPNHLLQLHPECPSSQSQRPSSRKLSSSNGFPHLDFTHAVLTCSPFSLVCFFSYSTALTLATITKGTHMNICVHMFTHVHKIPSGSCSSLHTNKVLLATFHKSLEITVLCPFNPNRQGKQISLKQNVF